MKELPKNYSPQDTEDQIYALWEKSDCFNPDHIDGEPFSVMMPPPNVTGVLHLGHALENSIMDTMVRYERMNGKKTLLLPGTDHAAIATQAKVEKILISQGILHPREELGREKLLHEIKAFAEDSKKTILSQIKKMGTSCDWSRLAYTFDDARNIAVFTVFKKMFDDGLIYRGHRVVNWSIKGQSTCSDEELEYIERPAKLYTFTYAKDFPIPIATTRPETKLGDTAVAVHPNDTRYQKYIGQTFTVNVGAKNPLKIKVIADDSVDPSFGTGALGVTPAHSAIDYDMYTRQRAQGNPIELIQVIDQNGAMTELSGPEYTGLSVEQAREKFVSWLRESTLLLKEEAIMQNVGTSDRFGDIVEAIPMTQWFIDVNKTIPGKNKSLKDLMREAVTIGHNADPNQKITICPKKFEKIYLNWIENLRDWCVSRQIWWGHRIPVWYCSCGEMLISQTQPAHCTSCTSTTFIQDADTLDTWFSSGLWTFSTLGWPEETPDFKTFHPSNWMQMGHEILFFWMARMILMSTYVIDQIPFKDVYIHGMLRDENGKKFSKSAGNNIDPIDIIEKFGTDALRLSLLSGIAPGNDSKFYEEKVIGARNFVSKLWNISRFIMSKSKLTTTQDQKIKRDDLTVFDKMIIQKMHHVIISVRKDLDNYRFSQAIEKLHHFTWNDFADWYIEISKFESNTATKQIILPILLKDLLALWHPFIPFVTEEIWQQYSADKLLAISPYPNAQFYIPYIDTHTDITSTADMIMEIISTIRTIRQEQNITPDTKISIMIDNRKSLLGTTEVLSAYEHIIKNLRTGITKIEFITADIAMPSTIAKTTTHGVTVILSLNTLIKDTRAREKKEKELLKMQKYISALENKLSNESFVTHAPKDIIAGEETKLKTAKKQAQDIVTYLDNIKT